MHAFLPRSLPSRLEPLTDLALDLHWTWNHAEDTLWHRLDAALWQRTRNPWVILQNVSQQRLDELASDATFLQALDQAATTRREYLQAPGWCGEDCRENPGTVAYFSMEFGLSEAFPLYAGGLGVLAGDYLKSASDLGLPVVGVGLLYQEGYFRQIIDAAGEQTEAYPNNEPSSLPIQPVAGPDGAWLRIGLPLPGRILFLRVWKASIGRVELYLLDSNDLRNGAADRGVTAKLYDGGPELRLQQEIVLGIGGWTLLDTLGIDVSVCHINEGHAAFATLERARRFMHREGLSFREALWATRAGNVFTTHTPVAAGFDVFPPSLIFKYSRGYLQDLGLTLSELLALGRCHPDDPAEPFNMAYLAMRGCAQTNAVSRLHGEVSRHLFAPLYPRWPVAEIPVRHVTNGVHVPSWDSIWSDRLWTRACGKARWRGAPDELSEAVATSTDAELWELAGAERRDLVHYAREALAWQLEQRGEALDQVTSVAQVLDTRVLTLGMARRFAGYKRPNLLLHDPDRLARLLLDADRPVQLIVAGKAHPADTDGKQLIREWMHFVQRDDVRHRVVFLEDYDMALAQQLVQGVDVWINTPRRPWEACGTSGMKVLANGGLNLSELDGWWAEAYAPELGWAIGHDSGTDAGDPDSVDRNDAETLYRVLESEVVPAFYDRDDQGIPREWVRRMRACMAHLAPHYSSNRMLIDYLGDFYLPAARARRTRCADGARRARELDDWHTALVAAWSGVRVEPAVLERDGEQWKARVTVHLGDIPPDHVRVELYADATSDLPALSVPLEHDAQAGVARGDAGFTGRVPATRPAEWYTPRMRPWRDDVFLPAESELVAWA